MSARRRAAPRRRAIRTEIESPAIVLRFSEWSESSRVVQLVLPEHGRVTVLARGVDRPTSPWRGVFDRLCRVEVALEAEEGRELHALRSARLLEHHPRVRKDLARWYRALYAVELVEAAVQPEQPARELFRALDLALAGWNADGANPDRVLLAFEWAYLDALGLAPALTACASCARALDPARSKTALFHPAAGGVQCSACRSRATVDLMPARSGARRSPWRRVSVATLLELERSRRDELSAREASDAAYRTARLLLDDFLRWQLERPSRVRPFLR